MCYLYIYKKFSFQPEPATGSTEETGKEEKMQTARIKSLKAADLVFPIIRGMITVYKTLPEIIGVEKPLELVLREYRNNLEYIEKSLEILTMKAGLSVAKVKPICAKLESISGKDGSMPAVSDINELGEMIADFCRKHKKILSEVYSEDSELYGRLHRKMVLKRRVMLSFSDSVKGREAQIEKLLSTKCGYDVDVKSYDPVDNIDEYYHMHLIYSTDPREIADLITRNGSSDTTILLTEIDPRDEAAAINMSRTLSRAKGISVILRPFSTMNILPVTETRYVARLVDFSKEVEAMEKEIDADEVKLVEDMTSIQLWAGLIVQTEWELAEAAEKSLKTAESEAVKS